MTATNKLRELLDKRGVKWKAEESEIDHVTTWKANGGHAEFYESKTTNPDLLQVNYYNLTPEQAIDITLGHGTCTLPETRVDHGGIAYNGVTEWRKCSACGEEVLAFPAWYCPNCGAKVVD